jgi:hypothetical protein
MDSQAIFCIGFPELAIGLMAIAPGVFPDDPFGITDVDGSFLPDDVSVLIRYV